MQITFAPEPDSDGDAQEIVLRSLVGFSVKLTEEEGYGPSRAVDEVVAIGPVRARWHRAR